MSDVAQASPKTIGQRLLPVCFIGTLLVAMAGWLWGIGYMIFGICKWLLA